MDSKILRMAQSKILEMIPFEFKLKASDLVCERVEVPCCEEIDNSELQAVNFIETSQELLCSQTHYVDISR